MSRRYSPPTCTLEISVNRSLWSLCTGQCSRKQIQFEITFDAPQSFTEKPLMISGDAWALEELYQAVKQYTDQCFDHDRSQRNNAQLLLESDSLEASSQPNRPVLPPPSKIVESSPEFTEHSSIYIQPQGSLTHQLYLGLLATEESDPMIQLGNLQLLDLVTALEECSRDLMAIAPPKPPFKIISWGFAKWTIGAIALLSLGFTALATSRSDRHPSPPPLSQPTLQSIPHSQSK
jgi:hypothetical protein